MAVINFSMHYPHQLKIPKYCLTASSGGFEYRTVVYLKPVINRSTKGSRPGSKFYVGTPHISRNVPFYTAALPPLSDYHIGLSTALYSNLLQSETTRETNLLPHQPTNLPTIR
jgi:hypothetical protein